ncbi:MAG: B12-binding domain-containing radical SAM protein [Candidatus Muirbacterium halophilum]|nr:B12-binding domain-containing radical SAM protein [Candidatus Muirbacterium halophilum]MCK9475146.1 B12-binding domain-containing radical SAM protein [Candidatus Muirbacterium halophilum]
MIVLINPPVSDKAPFPGKVQMGLASLAHYLKLNNFKVKIIDEDSIEEIFSILHSMYFDIEILGITALSYQVNNSLKIFERVKNKNPDIVTVFGGSAATGIGKKLLNNKFLDIVVLSEGEKAFLSIAQKNKYSKINGIIYKDKCNNIIENSNISLLKSEELFFPSRDLFKNHGIFYDQALKKNSILLMFSRGCTGRCQFCMAYKMFPGKVRFVEIEKVICHIKDIIKNHNIKSFVFDDDSFLSSKDYVEKFCDLIKPLNIIFRINVSQLHFDERLVLMLKKCGLKKITIGVESIFEDTQKIIKKHSDIEKIKNISEFCKQNNIMLSLLFIAALPLETSERLLSTINQIKEINPNGGFDFQVFQPHPGTYSNQELEKYGVILSEDLDDYFSDNIVYIPHGITKFDLKKILDSNANKKVSISGEIFISLFEKYKNNKNAIKINCDDFESTFEKHVIHWKGSKRCMSGLAMIKALGKGSISYKFFIDEKKISDYTLLCRLSSHVEGFPEGDEFCSVLDIFLNENFIIKIKLESIHTTGKLYEIKISSKYFKKGKNTIKFSVESEEKYCNGLSIFTFALNSFYSKYEVGIILV